MPPPMQGSELAEKPLAGTVICCTSISPEVRTRLADYAQSMGAEHKLDLTSDVTHLLVGDTDTPKYKYVAREREDVKVLQPEWVEAVRQCWIEAKPLDLAALETRYRLPTLSGLKICITGFDNLEFRARLQDNIIKNGGKYTGDMTKDITHLIVNKPEGKKYEYGQMWQKKLVTLQWYKESLSRGMQLEESLYHPSRPLDEQGAGAWIRKPVPHSVIGKRSRDEASGLEPARKLRRTASARLGSQSETLWGDIVGGAGFNKSDSKEQTLKPSKSMSAIQLNAVLPGREPKSAADITTNGPQPGFLAGKHFLVADFDERKKSKLVEIIQDNGGTIIDSELNFSNLSISSDEEKLVLVPHDMPAEGLTNSCKTRTRTDIVTEFWLEWCMVKRLYVNPRDYPLNALVSRHKPPGLSKLVINATGFHGLETLHISKLMTLLGATYDQNFSPSASLLICNQANINQQKFIHAQKWGVPVVSAAWLWSCIKNSRKAPVESYLITTSGSFNNTESVPNPQQDKHDKTPALSLDKSHQENVRNKAEPSFKLHADEHNNPSVNGPTESAGYRSTSQPIVNNSVTYALREISPNSPSRKDIDLSIKPKKSLFRNLDGTSSLPDQEQCDLDASSAPTFVSAAPHKAETLNGAIQDLLNIKAKAARVAIPAGTEPKKKLLGRALSNLSNSSATGNLSYSRASSIDTMNTDGIGSEIASQGPDGRRSQGQVDISGSRSFTGRAKAKMSGSKTSSVELGDPGLCREEYFEEEATPQMTQLVYEDSEETILLREKLAKKRQQKAQHDTEKAPPNISNHPRERRKIRDDDMEASTGWGAGRRTRHKGRVSAELDKF